MARFLNNIISMRSIVMSIVFCLFSITLLSAQESKVTNLSLKQCVQMAVEKNINVQNARIDKEKTKWKVSETRSTLFPKINVYGTFQDNLKLPTTMIPGEIFGQPGTKIPVQMGSPYSTTASVSLNQVLFNQTAFTALQLSKKLEKIGDLGIEKASEEMANEAAKLYFLTLTTTRQKKLVEENIARIQRLREITHVVVENGMGKGVDYDRINVNLENLNTQLNNVDAAIQQQQNMMKYLLDIPLQETIVLTDTVEMTLLQQSPAMESDFSDYVDIQILESQKEVLLLNQKTINSGYVPTLSFAGQYAYQGLREDFKNYFQDSPENKWFGSSYIGLNLSVPVFDGFEKRSKARQAQLDYQKTVATLENSKERFDMNYQNALNNYQNNKYNVQRQKQNIELAEKVYHETALKYAEGLAGLRDLLQDEIGLINAQASYLSALYNFKEAELKIMSLNGEIRQLINQ